MTKLLSLWDRFQLAFLRWLSRALLLLDLLFGVRWGERLLDRLSDRWQSQLDRLTTALSEVEKEGERLHRVTDALSIQAAALCLGRRKLASSELRFDPADPRDEEILDATIDLLVKARLAAIETRETAPGHFVYFLEPEWETIRAGLEAAANEAEPEMAEWLREGSRFIQDSLQDL